MYFVAIAVVLMALVFGATKLRSGRIAKEVRKRAHTEGYDGHAHKSVVHEHDHPHVTHNRREGGDVLLGEWEHLTSEHDHKHNHPDVAHSHIPHEDVEHEHLGEAHIHDHGHPTRS
jgi:hypothetical protein